ncbi:MAG: hypothetical protein E5W81_01795 [Mesorhizobium sp.]|nr:MAG: hypothetical protein E5V36_01750 [Mesorhizobium sp.]TKC00071.1 MAG: hypothetical protein E5W81_01795 [Mesorhizobium sp.]
MADGNVLEFLTILHARVTEADPNVAGNQERRAAFTRMVVDHLIEIGRVETGELAVWEGTAGRGVGRVDGYGLADDDDTLDLFISELGGDDAVRSVRADDLDHLVGQAGRFAEHCLRLKIPPSNVGTDAEAMVAAISRAKARVRRVRVFVLTDGISSARRLPKREVEGWPVEVDIWDLTRIVRSMSVEGGSEPIDLDFENTTQGALPFLRLDAEADYSTLLLMIPGKVLADAYEEHGARLLEYNVRSFLSVRGKVNRGIRQTIVEEPSRFIAYNNGIVITAESFYEKFLPGLGKAVARLTNVQIVNGGQTTATIHDTAKRLKADIHGVSVAAKIVIVGSDIRDAMVKQISKFANTQNPMQQADLSANEPFHVSVERLSKAIWCPGGQKRWFYERARGQYEVELTGASVTPARRTRFLKECPKELRFSKVDLAKFLNSWQRKPHEVSYGGQKNFIRFMEELRKKNGLSWEPDARWYQDIIAVAIIWSAAERLVRWEGLPAFRANVVAYLVSCLSYYSAGQLDLQKIWNAQGVSRELEQLMRAWVTPIRDALVESAATRQKNPTEWFKNPECWSEMELMSLPFSEPLPPEFKGETVRNLFPGMGEGQTSFLAGAQRIKAIDAQSWIKIAQWGSTSGELHWRQSGIATTLSGMAAHGWRREPSRKQVDAALTILNLLEERNPALTAGPKL